MKSPLPNRAPGAPQPGAPQPGAADASTATAQFLFLIIFVPFVAVALFMTGYALITTVVELCGVTLPARFIRVNQAFSSHSDVRGSPRVMVTYSYNVNGR